MADKVKPADVLPWAIGGGVLLILGGVAKSFGLFDHDPRTDPRLPPDVDVPDVDVPPTLTRQAARALADLIYAAIYGDGGLATGQTGEDEDAVIAALVEAQNDADVLLIMDQYGVRGGAWALTGDLDLAGAVLAYLEPSDRAAINADYTNKGIQIRF